MLTIAQARKAARHEAARGQGARAQKGRSGAAKCPKVAGVPTELEKDHEHKGDQLMERYGFVAVRLSQPRASMITPGVPDRRYYSTARGIAFWWEAKREDGKQSKAQRDFQTRCDACGDVYFCGTFGELAAWFAEEVRAGFPAWFRVHMEALGRLADAGVLRR